MNCVFYELDIIEKKIDIYYTKKCSNWYRIQKHDPSLITLHVTGGGGGAKLVLPPCLAKITIAPILYACFYLHKTLGLFLNVKYWYIARLHFNFNFNINLVKSWDSFIPTWSSNPATHPATTHPWKFIFRTFSNQTAISTSTWFEISASFILSEPHPPPPPTQE